MLKKLTWSVICLITLVICAPFTGKAATSGKVVTTMSGKSIAKRIDNKTYQFINQGSASKNSRALKNLLNNNAEKTIILPSGTIKVNSVIPIGSHTTLKAYGATIVQTSASKGLLRNDINSCSGTPHYNLVKDVTILGGTWKNSRNSKKITMFRFAHGRDITIRDAYVQTNFKGHGIELIACADCVIDKCRVIASNSKTKSSSSVEEAIQIDIASKTTAPGVYSESGRRSKYVKGQTCRNITISNTTAYSSRGICANFCKKEGGKWLNKLHYNIKVINCDTTGSSSEGLMLLNVAGATVKDSKIVSNSRRNNAYSTGLHYVNFSKSSFSSMQNVFSGNRVYGRFFGMQMSSNTRSKFGKTTVENNRFYCKKGSSRALRLSDIKSLKSSGNSYSSW